jgi:hypothetical protein
MELLLNYVGAAVWSVSIYYVPVVTDIFISQKDQIFDDVSRSNLLIFSIIQGKIQKVALMPFHEKP